MAKKSINKKEINDIELIRLTTAGSVDDGKSTLIGRLLHDCHSIFEDQYLSIKNTCSKVGKEVDLAYLLDGLKAEREQGITIDVAYRYFSTLKRRFIIADVPGHEQYTKNMITGSSTADVAIILIDATKGVLIQSKRHLFITSLMNIPHILIAVNKMDLIDYKKETYEKIKKDLISFANKLNIKDLQFIPISALKGDMVVERDSKMNWYQGDTLYSYLENIEISSDRNLIDFRFPVQLVLKIGRDQRGYAGKIEGGIIHKGSKVIILPSGVKTKIKSIIVDQKEKNYAFAPQSSLITLKDQVDVSRGDMIVREKNLPELSNEFEAIICWMSNKLLKEKFNYLIKHTTNVARCSIEKIRYRLNIDTLHQEKTKVLKINDIGRICLKTNKSLMLDSYIKNRNTGCFILVDEVTNNTVAIGMIRFVKRINGKKKKKERKQQGAVLWFTGLSGSGKSTVADKVYQYLRDKNIVCERLDGDVLRKNLTKNLDFSKQGREKNIAIAGFVAKMLAQNGIIVLASFISPYQKQREELRKKIDNFIEIYVNAPLKICEKRDVKGLYKKAKRGEVKNFTGIDNPYESPQKPEIELKTDHESKQESVEKVINYLQKNKYHQLWKK